MKIKQIALAADQFINTLTGGYADETLSARSWRLRSTQPFKTLRPIIDTLFFFDKNHCEESYKSELFRKQLPSEYSEIKLTAVASKSDIRDYQFIATVNPRANTDLRNFNRDIEDQSSVGSCVSHSITNAIEIVTEQKGQWEDLSRQFHYYVTRDLEHILHREGIYSLRDALESARRYGLCLESEWPYVIGKENVRPSELAYTSATTRKITRYEAVDISKSMVFGKDVQLGIDNIKAALAEGLPVMFVMGLGRKFFSLNGPLESQKYYRMDLPGSVATGNEFVGSHAMVIVGNSDELGGFIVENQWGKNWGDKGYCLVPYEVIQDFSEAWVIRGYKDIDLINPKVYSAQMQVVRFYVAVLGRAPEYSGFKWWFKEVLKGAKLDGAAQGFLESEESRTRFVNNGEVVCDIINSLDTFNNKVKVAEYFAIDLACDKLDVAKICLDSVTSDAASIEAAKIDIRKMVDGGVL